MTSRQFEKAVKLCISMLPSVKKKIEKKYKKERYPMAAFLKDAIKTLL